LHASVGAGGGCHRRRSEVTAACRVHGSAPGGTGSERGRGSLCGPHSEPTAVPVRPRWLQQDVQEPADHEDAQQDACKQRGLTGEEQCVGGACNQYAGAHDVLVAQGRPQQEDPIALPQVQEDICGLVRASTPLRAQAFGGRETVRLPQVWQEILHRGTKQEIPRLHLQLILNQ